MTPLPPDAPTARVQVLVVDDHAPLRALISKGLTKRLDWDVTMAADIEEALSELARGSFAAVVADVNLPGESSIDALPRLRALCPDGRIVLMSAAVPPGLARQATDAGADAFVPKSSGLTALCDALTLAPTVNAEE